MSPAAAEQVVLTHLAADLPFLPDQDLTDLAAEHAVETGHYAAEARRLIDKEREYRLAVRHSYETAEAEWPLPAVEVEDAERLGLVVGPEPFVGGAS